LKHRDRLSDDKALTADLRLGVRNYTDSYVVDEDSAQDLGAKQQDLNVNLDLGLAWRLSSAWSVDFGLGYDELASNQVLLDTSAPSNYIYTPNGDTYYDVRLDPGVHWNHGRWAASAGYELLLRQTDHYIQDAGGDYESAFQKDVEHGVSVSLERALGRGFKARADFTARDVLSNQEFAHGGALAAYSYYNGGVGLAYEWASGK
jgi:hypothetical protein